VQQSNTKSFDLSNGLCQKNFIGHASCEIYTTFAKKNGFFDALPRQALFLPAFYTSGRNVHAEAHPTCSIVLHFAPFFA
jgi:hypothetical protein